MGDEEAAVEETERQLMGDKEAAVEETKIRLQTRECGACTGEKKTTIKEIKAETQRRL